MEFVIVTGMSGAGKSTALKMLEDMGYFCADNLPVPLVEKFAELALGAESEYKKVALGIDIRTGKGIGDLQKVLEHLSAKGIPYKIMYLDSADAVLLKRYKETRRSHPLARDGRIEDGIRTERNELKFLRARADFILDTSTLLTRELRSEMERIISGNVEYQNIFITILSFGFKHGIPVDSDLVFDVRFLPNPYYVDELRYRTGKEKDVQDFVMKTETGHIFLKKLEDMVEYLLPNYVAEGKNQLVISIGCTGGKHRSVTIAEKLAEYLHQHSEYGLKLEHRDILR